MSLSLRTRWLYNINYTPTLFGYKGRTINNYKESSKNILVENIFMNIIGKWHLKYVQSSSSMEEYLRVSERLGLIPGLAV